MIRSGHDEDGYPERRSKASSEMVEAGRCVKISDHLGAIRLMMHAS